MANVEYLKMVQAVIDRMGRNSFALKGWSVTLAAALLTASKADSNPTYALIAVYTVVVFGVLDAYYLAIERAFRDLYNDAIKPGAAETWSLTPCYGVGKVAKAIVSPSVLLLHGVSLAAAAAVAYLTW